MMLLRPLTIVIYAVVIAAGAASDEVVMKAVGDQVSFRPDKPLPSPVTSIIWKHKTSDGTVVKAIEWEDGETTILNPRFKIITTVDVTTGQITITNLKLEHSGVYFMEINSKEQEQRFTLTIKEPVPQPEIKIERTDNPNVMYLRCENREPIIWKNSTGETLKGSPLGDTIGESITVVKALETNPDNFYTCTLDNSASKKTSDRVYVRDLFKDGSNGNYLLLVIFLVIFIPIIICIALLFLYKCKEEFRKRVDDYCPCIGECVAWCCPCIAGGKKKNSEETPDAEGKQNNSAVPSQSNEHLPLKESENGQDAKL